MCSWTSHVYWSCENPKSFLTLFSSWFFDHRRHALFYPSSLNRRETLSPTLARLCLMLALKHKTYMALPQKKTRKFFLYFWSHFLYTACHETIYTMYYILESKYALITLICLALLWLICIMAYQLLMDYLMMKYDTFVNV